MFAWFRRATFATLFIFVTFVPGWSFAQTAAPQDGLSEAERAAIAALIKKAPKDGKPRFYDLTDPREEMAMRALMRIDGVTAENRPYLFKSIEAHKQEQLRARARHELSLEAPKPRVAAGAPIPENIDQVINIGTDNWTTVSSVAYSTYYGGSVYILTAVNVFDSEQKSIAYKKEDQYGDGRILSVQSPDGANPSGKAIDAVGQYLYTDKQGKIVGPLYSSLSGGYYPKQISETKPQITTSNKNIVICLNRANPDPHNPTQCDYGPTDPNVPNPQVHVKIPFQGAIQYFGNIDVDPNTGKPYPGTYSVSLYLVGRTTGGSCSGVQIGQTFMDNPNTKIVGDTITWNMEYADFGNVCYQNNEFYTLTFSLTLPIAQTPIVAAITNDLNTKPTVSTLKIPQLQVQYGCVLEGTQVLMADGTKRRIEDVKIGDQVVGRKGPLYVNSTTVGWDSEFVQLTHQHGSVTVTLGHPIVTQRGLVRASEVKRDDTIYSSDRNESSVKITGLKLLHEAQARRVYNLMLTAPNGPPPADPVDANFYAGNILIGDAEGQRLLMQKPEDTASIRSRLPAEMRIDFDNWRKEQAAHK